jgi:hypothetical protein
MSLFSTINLNSFCIWISILIPPVMRRSVPIALCRQPPCWRHVEAQIAISDRKHLAASLSSPLPRRGGCRHPALLLTKSPRLPCISCSCVSCLLSFPALLDPWPSLACAPPPLPFFAMFRTRPSSPVLSALALAPACAWECRCHCHSPSSGGSTGMPHSTFTLDVHTRGV